MASHQRNEMTLNERLFEDLLYMIEIQGFMGTLSNSK